MKSSRGQVFSGEFVMSYIILLIVLSLILYLWNTTTREIIQSDKQDRLNEAAIDAAEQLVRTPGSPRYWNHSDVTSVGLVNESRHIMSGKALEFVYMMDAGNSTLCSDGDSNYDCNKYLLGLGNYEFYFNITYFNRTTVVINNTGLYAGMTPDEDERKVTILRNALIDEDIVSVYLTVWES
ncbi:MAG: hypothetical protein ABIH11_00095 [Candidatus Altiarchaeota archaeon]